MPSVRVPCRRTVRTLAALAAGGLLAACSVTPRDRYYRAQAWAFEPAPAAVEGSAAPTWPPTTAVTGLPEPR